MQDFALCLMTLESLQPVEQKRDAVLGDWSYSGMEAYRSIEEGEYYCFLFSTRQNNIINKRHLSAGGKGGGQVARVFFYTYVDLSFKSVEINNYATFSPFFSYVIYNILCSLLDSHL